MLILDVGCGDWARGNVNVDLYKYYTPQVRDQKRLYPMQPHSIPNFVQADAHYLPFKDNVFDKILCIEVLEHLDNPFKAIKELFRVCKDGGTIKISVPHRFANVWDKGKYPYHQNFFTRSWFEKAFKKLGIRIFPASIEFRNLPHPYIPIIALPYHMKITIEKKREIEETKSKTI